MLFALSMLFFALWLVALEMAMGNSLAYLALALSVVCLVVGILRRPPRRAKSA